MSSRIILIADENGGRGRQVANALEAADHECRVVTDGAAALEQALAVVPEIVAVHVALPLIDGLKLSEIVRANPKTRSARFLFFGNERREEILGSVGDLTLGAEAGTQEIVEGVTELLERHDRIASLDERADVDLEFDGDLLELGLAELIQMLQLRASCGELVLTPDGEHADALEGRVWLQDGEIVAAAVGHVRGEKALFRMLDWRAGRFVFEPADEKVSGDITAPTRSLMAEGLRQLDEWNRLAPKLPPLESPVKIRIDRGELPHIVHPLTQAVLQLLEQFDRVGDVVDHCPFSDYQVLRTLHTLGDRGIIEFGRAKLAHAPRVTHALFNEAQTRRLRTFASQGLARETETPNPKLLVVAPHGQACERFARLLERVPGAELAPKMERGQMGPDDLESIGRVEIDRDFAIDLVQLPLGAGFEPLWNLAAHRALGTIFLLDAQVTSSAARIAPLQKALAKRSGARTFHVVMLSAGERLSPDDLRENLDLIDDASLFLLPTESDKDPGALVHSLFARIVP